VLLGLLAIACTPFSEEEVAIEVNDTVTLACTLSIPDGAAPWPAVILISGSGPATRECDAAGFRLCRETAHHLAAQGIAALRCDKRGFGLSTGSPRPQDVTTSDFADDALAQLAYLETRAEIDRGRVGLHGSSEGAMVAAMVDARSDDVEFVILAAAPALHPRQIPHRQLADYLRRQGKDEDEITARIELWDRIYDAIEQGELVWELRKELRRELLADAERAPAAWREQVGDVEDYVDRMVDRNLDISISKWGRFLISYDPREDLMQTDSRALALYGSKDVQIRAEPNARALEAAFQEAGKTNYEIRILENANHLFQEAVTGEVEEYSELPREFIPGYLEAITAWVLDEPSSGAADLSR
jgi:pimeloyl-ACP methyl ester carboxylesterase